MDTTLFISGQVTIILVLLYWLIMPIVDSAKSTKIHFLVMVFLLTESVVIAVSVKSVWAVAPVCIVVAGYFLYTAIRLRMRVEHEKKTAQKGGAKIIKR